MRNHHPVETFRNYSSQEKIDFLVRLAHMLTILARDTYEVGESGLTHPSRLRVINEVQHRVTGFLIALLKDDPKRYPDEILVKTILEHPDNLDLQQQLRRIFDQLAEQSIVPA